MGGWLTDTEGKTWKIPAWDIEPQPFKPIHIPSIPPIPPLPPIDKGKYQEWKDIFEAEKAIEKSQKKQQPKPKPKPKPKKKRKPRAKKPEPPPIHDDTIYEREV